MSNVGADGIENTVKALKGDGKKFGQSFTWITVIFIGLIAYHCYSSYNEQMKLEEVEQKEGMDCLYHFKTEECNPYNLTEKCKELLNCVQESSSDIDEMEVMTQMIKRTSSTLTETMLGPVALIFGVLLINYLRDKT